MRDSRGASVFGLMLILAFTMPMICVALETVTSATADAGAMPGGCHGHHGSMPAHVCCYGVHQMPMATPAAPPQIAWNDSGGWVSRSADSEPQAHIALATVVSDSSPPLPAILRI